MNEQDNPRYERRGAGRAIVSKDTRVRAMRERLKLHRAKDAARGQLPPREQAADLGAPVDVVPGAPNVRSVSDVDPYQPGSPYSWFLDRAHVAMVEDYKHQRGRSLMGDGDSLPLLRGDGGVEDARRRLATVKGARSDTRDMSTAAAAGGAFSLDGAPPLIERAFGTSARATAVMPGLLTIEQLPPHGNKLRVAGFAGTNPAGAQEDGGTVEQLSDTTRASEVPVVTVAAAQVMSYQLADRAGSVFDVAVAREMGAAMATKLDGLVLSGSGTSGEPTGLLNVSGITSTTYTDASPTAAELRPKLWAAYRDVYAAGGLEPDALVLHPRRLAMLYAATGAAPVMGGRDLPVEPTACGSVPTNLGTGTNEDRALLFAREAVLLFMARPTVAVHADSSLSATGELRVTAYQYAALAIRRPEAIGVLSGTGMADPTL